MKQITFEDIYTLGNIKAENAYYRHFHYPEMLIRYDSNFIEFKTLLSLTEFKETEVYLREYHLKRGQKHVKFYFPANIKPTEKLIAYLTNTGYEIGFMELYAIQPKHFPSVNNNPDIDIQVVIDKNLDELLNMKYKNDLEFGSEFAKQKADLIKRQFDDQDILISNETVEIDELTVDEVFRNKGVGSRLQKFVMDSFPEKVVILVADGEDTPKEMYKKQNYQYHGFKYEALKVY